MSARAAREEQTRGSTDVRRAVLEVTRAVSLTPWTGDYVFNAASPGATPSAQRGEGSNPVPYSAEVHATRYQYGLAMTPGGLRDPKRAATALRELARLGPVAGNHGRFLFDFSPDSIVLRLTDDPAPRLLYSFGPAGSDPMDLTRVALRPEFLTRVEAGDIDPDELIVGGPAADDPAVKDVLPGGNLFAGVKAAVEAGCGRIDAHADVTGKGGGA